MRAEWRRGVIFSRVLYQLSYLAAGPMVSVPALSRAPTTSLGRLCERQATSVPTQATERPRWF
jgi:hypothetical protein